MTPFLWALLAALSWGFAPIIEKLGLMKTPVYQGLFYRCLGVIVGLILLIIYKYGEVKQAVTHIPHGWAYLITGGFLASIVGQVFFYNALKTGEASRVVPIGACYPLISFILGIIFLGEQLTATKVAGLILVVLGVWFLK